MPDSDVDLVVIGGGAAGVAAARRLADASIRCLLVEARPRLGGRPGPFTIATAMVLISAAAGCTRPIVIPGQASPDEQGFTIEKTPPPWMNRPLEASLLHAAQRLSPGHRPILHAPGRSRPTRHRCRSFQRARSSEPLDPLLDAIGTYISGAELERVSLKDLSNYQTPTQLARGRRLWHADQPLTARTCRLCSTVRSGVSITAANA